MYLQETCTFKTRRKATGLIASLFLLSVIFDAAVAKGIHPCPQNCQCYVDHSFLYPLNTAKCDVLVRQTGTYPNILQLKLTPAPGARSCHLPHVSASLFPKLQKLDLSNCSLTGIPSTDPNRFHNLDSLDLSNNMIRKIHSDSLDSYPRVSHVTFANNPLYSQSPSALNSSTLVQLSLDSCHMLQLYPYMFAGLPKLRDLSLSDNQISVVYADTFPANLATLDLSRNRIVDVPTNEFSRLENLAQLTLNANPINCTCGLMHFQEWLSGKGVVFMNGITCEYPEKFAKQNLSSLREDDLCGRQGLSFSSENPLQLDEDYVNDGGETEMQRVLQADDLQLAVNSKEAEPIPVHDGSGDGPDETQKSTSTDAAVSRTSESTTTNSVTQFQNELHSTSESASGVKSVSETSSAAPIDSVGTTLAASSEASSSTSETTTPSPETNSIAASNDSPTSSTAPSETAVNTNPGSSQTLSAENLSPTSSDASSVASESTTFSPSAAPSETSSETTTPITSPNTTSVAPEVTISETTTPTSSPASSETSPDTTAPTPSSDPSEASPETMATGPSPSTTSAAPLAANPETTTPASSPNPSEASPETTTPIPSPSATSSAPSATTSETTTPPIPSPASANSTSIPPSNPSSGGTATEIPEVKPAETPENPSASLKPAANASNSTSVASSDAHTAGDKKHADSSSQLYGYAVPGLAVLITCFVVLALYCGKCASKVDAYKVAETEEEGAELQEISLLPDSNRPSIMKYSSKYPGEKENGQTEKLMNSHDQSNGGSNVGTEVNGNIAEVNGNGSQHSNETVDCCKLVNGQSAANQNDLGDVECTVAKVTTLPDSVPQTAVIRDI